MTAFAETATETATGTAGRVYIIDTATPAAETDVVLSLNQNAGIVWFSAGANQNVDTYVLSLPGIDGLNQSTSGNGNWVAKGTDLKLNWNIVSCSKVKIDLIVGGKLIGQNNSSNEIGWKVSFKPTEYSGSSPKAVETETGTETVTISAGYSGLNDTSSATAVKKDNTVYGSSGTLSIDKIITENTYGKNVDTYKATLTAMISTID